MKYALAAALYAKKRGQYRSLGNYNYMGSDYVDGQIVYVCYNGKPSSGWSRKFMTIYPDDTIELGWHHNGQGMANDLARYTSLTLNRCKSRILRHGYELILPNGQRTPMFDGIKVRGNEVLNPQEKLVRTIDDTKAKAVRDKIKSWKKVFDVVFLLNRPEIELDDNGRYGSWHKKLSKDFEWPKFNDEVTADMAMALLKDAALRTERMEHVKTDEVEEVDWGGRTRTQHKWVKQEKPTYYANLLKNATEHLRERWYEEVGAYVWVPDVKQAA